MTTDNPTPTDDSPQPHMIKADLLTALVLVVLGLVVVYFSWTMPRLEERRIHPATIPGLVPLALGAALVLTGSLLALRSVRLPAPQGWSDLLGLFRTREAARVLVLLAWALFYTLVMVGWLPFWAASMIFIFGFIILFEVVMSPEPLPFMASAKWALPIAIIAGGAVFYVFERIFLVRLP